VIVLDDDGSVLSGFAAPEPNELARHKLLDLIGDLYFHGGPPLGAIAARYPGHATTHEVLCRALREGIVVRQS
jgi:UDP-3-O-acyl-N-acetylglucosamine deacetylase